MGSVGAKNVVNTWLGAPGKDIFERFDNNISKAFLTSINPNYLQDGTFNMLKENAPYRHNCALCSVAGILAMKGYNVEAAPADGHMTGKGFKMDKWRGFNSVFDVDWTNHDNFVAPSSKVNYSGTDYWESKANPNKFSVKSAKGATDIIEKTMTKWGTHSAAIMNVKWKNSNSAHAVVVFKEKYDTTIFDFQTGKMYSGKTQILEFMKNTSPTKTGLYRLDNVPIKSNIPDIDKMIVKKKK